MRNWKNYKLLHIAESIDMIGCALKALFLDSQNNREFIKEGIQTYS